MPDIKLDHMAIEVREVSSRAELKKYIHLPAEIHRDHVNWVPPLYGDEWQFFSSKKNRHFDHCDTGLWLAWRDGKIVGRIMGVIHHGYNEKKGEKHARFNFLETWDDREVIEALIDTVAGWAREKGMEKLVGPLAFSDKDPQGFMISGFDEPVAVATHCNFKYMIDHLADLGFEKELDLVVYKIEIPDPTPALYLKVAERTMRNNPELKLIEFKSRRKLKPWIRPIFTLINETFTEIYGFEPFTLEEMDDFADRYLLVMDPRLIKVIVDGQGNTVAFIIGMPDIHRGFQKSRGYLFPFGWYHLLTAGRKSDQMNLLLGAVHPDWQNRGLDTVMGSAQLESARKLGLKYIDSHLEMETNTKVRAEMEYMGGEVYKTYRIFARSL